MDFDDIVDGVHTARSRGYEPMQVHLGTEETHDLLKDANFNRASGVPAGAGSSIGTVFGLDVQNQPAEHMRIITAQCDEHVEFYIF